MCRCSTVTCKTAHTDARDKCLQFNATVSLYFDKSPAASGITFDEYGNPYCTACGKAGWSHLYSKDRDVDN